MTPEGSSEFGIHDRNRVRRAHKRAAYDKQTVYDIIDSHFLCHVAFEKDGQPFIIPTSHWREGDRLYFHGASKSMLVQHMTGGGRACLSVTQLDGLVLARSAFSHSVNYRSAICFGTGRLVTDETEFDRQMELFFEKLSAGRWPQLRPMTGAERKATGLIELDIEDASAKVRAGGPGDSEEADYPVWAGHVPMTTVYTEPVTAPEGVAAPLSHGIFDGYDFPEV